MTPRAPDAEEIAVVLIGSFNPGIFHPEWFRRQEILLPQEADEANPKHVSPEMTEVVFLDMTLTVLPQRFIIKTHDASRGEKLQDLTLNVLNRLPHTPITACGINDVIQFDIKDVAYWHKIGHSLAPKELIWNELLKNPGLGSLVINGAREGEFPGTINITVGPSKKFAHGLAVNSNFHFTVPRDGETPHSELVTPFIQKEWKAALDQSRQVAYRIFAEIKPDAR